MATVINMISTNYNVSNEQDNLKMTGSFNYSNKINDLRLEVYEDGTYIGNIYYNENENGNANMNLNVDMAHMMAAFSLVSVIISDINTHVNE